MLFARIRHISASLSKLCVKKGALILLLCSIILGVLSSCAKRPQVALIPPLVHLPAGEVLFRPAGKTLNNSRQVSPPPITVQHAKGLSIMQRQLSQAEYSACVQAKACKALDAIGPHNSPDLPVTGINWHDAQTYANWLSSQTGQHWRLPTYAEWVYAAGELFRPEALIIENEDTSQQWLVAYEEEVRRELQEEDTRVRPFGGYGSNSAGLLDMSGSIWEWTSDCYTLRRMDADNRQSVSMNTHCGVRVAAGRHTAYITDFIRDPKNGACSVGTPPAHLGVRLVLQADSG